MTYHSESIRLLRALEQELPNLVGGTLFRIGDVQIAVEGKDGLGGLIEEWLGVWARQNSFLINSANSQGQSQEFPDYYIGTDNKLLEIKCFDASASANFDIANFDAYCKSLAFNPQRLFADYIIFSYTLNESQLSITNVWLKKIWEITCPSARYSLKTQNKKGIIYNIRPATFYSKRCRFDTFSNWKAFAEALYDTEKEYHSLSSSNNELIFSKNLFSTYGLKY